MNDSVPRSNDRTIVRLENSSEPSNPSGSCGSQTTDVQPLSKSELASAYKQLDDSLAELPSNVTSTDLYDPNNLNSNKTLGGFETNYEEFDRVLLVQDDSNGYLVGGFDRYDDEVKALPFVEIEVESDGTVSTTLDTSSAGEPIYDAYSNSPIQAPQVGSQSTIGTDKSCPAGLVHRCAGYSLKCLKNLAPGWLETACGVLPAPAAIACLVGSMSLQAGKCCTKYTCSPPNVY